MTEDIFDMTNVRILKEIEKEKMEDVYTFLCLRSAELIKASGSRNLCLQNICSAGLLVSRENSSQNKIKCPAPKSCIFK